jgi:hypothetical protein
MITGQPEPYPESWTPWVKRNDPSPIAGMYSPMGWSDAEHTDPAHAYPANWRI